MPGSDESFISTNAPSAEPGVEFVKSIRPASDGCPTRERARRNTMSMRKMILPRAAPGLVVERVQLRGADRHGDRRIHAGDVPEHVVLDLDEDHERKVAGVRVG